MPTYDYQCRACGTVTEVIHSMLVDGPSVCELCGGKLRRVLYPTGIIFKGSGFYRNDSRAGSSGSEGAASAGGATDRDGGSDKSAGSDNNGESSTSGGSDTGKKSGSTTPQGGSSDATRASTDGSSG
ncbi:MAG: FmdB family transcriptional regulator [Chloroflexi bacterium]|nr:FmdB family transcriptional regulator [Chloroflexota bacterium]